MKLVTFDVPRQSYKVDTPNVSGRILNEEETFQFNPLVLRRNPILPNLIEKMTILVELKYSKVGEVY